MTDQANETPQERKRRKARERKRKQREKEEAHLAAVGAEDLKLTVFRGTKEALDRLIAFNECEQWQEVTTLLIHNADKLIERDPSQLRELLKVDMSHKGESPNENC
ncbi:hypothetical protein [Neptuniibacter sp.]|uniref:hypothetical protein n=1 Tax=Neptuniibacter sp. TaxID=1962643 RepID=UPI00260D1CF5|nr:hypothetical protein [Neptuniibacter sp.]MCP4597821.1 hypothetical protein [Neptuniibacter sp.]